MTTKSSRFESRCFLLIKGFVSFTPESGFFLIDGRKLVEFPKQESYNLKISVTALQSIPGDDFYVEKEVSYADLAATLKTYLGKYCVCE